MNQLVIILYSEQGKGKSSWIRRLLPPEWKEYFYNGIIDPSNKDAMWIRKMTIKLPIWQIALRNLSADWSMNPSMIRMKM